VEINIHWTRKALEHIVQHGISKTDVEDMLASRTYYARRHGGRLVLIGRSAGGMLFAVVERSSEVLGRYEVVTSRRASPSERALFLHRGKGVR
jgi:hypothetical protein